MKIIFTKTIESHYYQFYKDNKEFFMLVCPFEKTADDHILPNMCEGMIYQCDHIPQTRHKVFITEVQKTFEEMENAFIITKFYFKSGFSFEKLLTQILNVLFYHARKNTYNRK